MADIDLDTLLHRNPTFEDVADFWRNGEFYQTRYLVAAIKKWLRTPEQKKVLDDLDLSIEEMLNGSYTEDQSAAVGTIYDAWNQKLGFRAFGE